MPDKRAGELTAPKPDEDTAKAGNMLLRIYDIMSTIAKVVDIIIMCPARISADREPKTQMADYIKNASHL